MQDPEILKQDGGVPRFMKGYLARDYQLFAVEKKDQKVGGVHAFVYTPKPGVSAKNKEQGPDQSSWGRIFRLLAWLRGARVYSRFCLGRD